MICKWTVKYTKELTNKFTLLSTLPSSIGAQKLKAYVFYNSDVYGVSFLKGNTNFKMHFALFNEPQQKKIQNLDQVRSLP